MFIIVRKCHFISFFLILLGRINGFVLKSMVISILCLNGRRKMILKMRCYVMRDGKYYV